jgi:hypothetical protein
MWLMLRIPRGLPNHCLMLTERAALIILYVLSMGYDRSGRTED